MQPAHHCLGSVCGINRAPSGQDSGVGLSKPSFPSVLVVCVELCTQGEKRCPRLGLFTFLSGNLVKSVSIDESVCIMPGRNGSICVYKT